MKKRKKQPLITIEDFCSNYDIEKSYVEYLFRIKRLRKHEKGKKILINPNFALNAIAKTRKPYKKILLSNNIYEKVTNPYRTILHNAKGDILEVLDGKDSEFVHIPLISLMSVSLDGKEPL